MMKKLLYSSFAVMAMAFSVNVSAQTAYVGMAQYPAAGTVEGSEGRIVSFDVATPETLLDEPCVLPVTQADMSAMGGGMMDDFHYIKAGATVGNTYYAFTTSDFGQGGFAQLNFKENKVGTIKNGEEELDVRDMAYDASTETLYATVRDKGDNGAATGDTKIYTVDVTDGSLTEYCTLADMSVSGITFAPDGTLYAVEDEDVASGLFHTITFKLGTITLNGAETTFTEVGKITEKSNLFSSLTTASLAMNGDKLYFVYGVGKGFLLSFSTDATGAEEKSFPYCAKPSGLTFTMSTEGGDGVTPDGGEEEEDNGVCLSSVDTYGDVMGQFPDNTVSKRTVTFYDQYNNPIREVKYGRQVQQFGDNPWVMQYYTKYDYNDKQLLVSKHSEIVQEYVRGEYYYKSNNDTVNYEYDAEGRLIKESTPGAGKFTTYEYDAEGRLVKEITSTPDRFMTNGGNPLLTTTTYSEFTDFGEPKLIVTEDYRGDKTCKVVAFDGEHKVKATTYDDEQMLDESATDVEHWVWRNDSIVEYKRNLVYDGEESENKRTVYECVNGDPNHVRVTSYYKSGDTWRREGLPMVYNYSRLDATLAPTELTVTPVKDAVNSSTVAFTAPSFPVSEAEISFDIYRNGIHVGTVQLTDNTVTFDPETGKASFVDTLVANGTYDYMVQTIMKNDVTGDSVALNVSEIVPVTYNVELPAVTNIRGTERYASGGANYVTVEWDEPEDLADNLMFEYYNIFIDGLGQANADDAGQIPVDTTVYDITFPDDELGVYVQSVYHFGRVNSDTVTIVLAEVPTAISEVAQSVAENKVSITSSAITVDGVAASVTVFSMGGAVEASYRNVSSADISALQPGVYVAVVNVDGKNVALKFTK